MNHNVPTCANREVSTRGRDYRDKMHCEGLKNPSERGGRVEEVLHNNIGSDVRSGSW